MSDENTLLKSEIAALEAKLEPLREQLDALERDSRGKELAALVGKCFEDDIYDNDGDRTFIKVIRASSYSVDVLKIDVDRDPDPGDCPFDIIETREVLYEHAGWDKEIGSKAFGNRLKAAIEFLQGCSGPDPARKGKPGKKTANEEGSG
jgi:hypothetical protein